MARLIFVVKVGSSQPISPSPDTIRWKDSAGTTKVDVDGLVETEGLAVVDGLGDFDGELVDESVGEVVGEMLSDTWPTDSVGDDDCDIDPLAVIDSV